MRLEQNRVESSQLVFLLRHCTMQYMYNASLQVEDQGGNVAYPQSVSEMEELTRLTTRGCAVVQAATMRPTHHTLLIIPTFQNTAGSQL